MKANVYDLKGEKKTQINLPEQFTEAYRPDLIQRAAIAIQTTLFQPKGNFIGAGRQNTAEYIGMRHARNKLINIGVARLPRKKNGNRDLGQLGDVASVPQAKGGPRAHPPRVDKILVEKINKKEKTLAIRSAISATMSKDLATTRGHVTESVKEFPVIVVKDLEQLKTTKQVSDAFEKLGLLEDVQKAKDKRKVRAGTGKGRGRKYKKRKGPLLVVSSDCPAIKAAQNLEGVEVIQVNYLNAHLLAPGTHAGRLTVWSEAAIEKLDKEKLFPRK